MERGLIRQFGLVLAMTASASAWGDDPPFPVAWEMLTRKPNSATLTAVSEPNVLASQRVSLSSAYLGPSEATKFGASLRGGRAFQGGSILFDDEVGAEVVHHLGDNEILGVRASVGSPSDRPFSGGDVITYSMLATYGFPSGENSRWFFFLNSSNNRALINYVPLPGAAYMHMPKRGTFYLIGIPFAAMRYGFDDHWSVSASYAIVRSVRAEVAYTFFYGTQALVFAQWSQQSFLLSGRSDTKDRLFYEEKKAALAGKMMLAKWFRFELHGGIAWDRRELYGHSVTSSQVARKFDGTGFYGLGQLGFSF